MLLVEYIFIKGKILMFFFVILHKIKNIQNEHTYFRKILQR
jgi:hypothetical protein